MYQVSQRRILSKANFPVRNLRRYHSLQYKAKHDVRVVGDPQSSFTVLYRPGAGCSNEAPNRHTKVFVQHYAHNILPYLPSRVVRSHWPRAYHLVGIPRVGSGHKETLSSLPQRPLPPARVVFVRSQQSNNVNFDYGENGGRGVNISSCISTKCFSNVVKPPCTCAHTCSTVYLPLQHDLSTYYTV